MSLQTLVDTFTTNGQTVTRAYDAALRKLTDRTTTGRELITELDGQGRLLSRQTADLFPVRFAYNGRGLLTTTTRASGLNARVYSVSNDALGLPISVTDPLLRSVGMEYDPAGRLTKVALPDGRDSSATYDANGNLTSVTPPGRPAHVFGYTPVDLQSVYTPPDVGTGVKQTLWRYDLDRRQVTSVTRPDAGIINYGLDGAGRLGTVTLSRGEVRFAYDPTTGKLETVTAPDGGTLSYTYDGSLLTSTTWAGDIDGTVSRTYNNNNIRLSSTSVNGVTPLISSMILTGS